MEPIKNGAKKKKKKAAAFSELLPQTGNMSNLEMRLFIFNLTEAFT